MSATDAALAPVLAHLDSRCPGHVAGVYLYGSAAASGLRPDSDIDLLVLTRHSMCESERAGLVSVLLRSSGWTGHAGTLPSAAAKRPLEVTGLVLADIQPWKPAPMRDFQYGEWLRGDLLAGELPAPVRDQDVVTLVATAQSTNRALRGPALGDLVEQVPAGLLRSAIRGSLPGLLEGIDGDERNTLLTLARMVVTLGTGRIVAKDEAAALLAPELSDTEREVLERARAGYLGRVDDDWTSDRARTLSVARSLAARGEEIAHR